MRTACEGKGQTQWPRQHWSGYVADAFDHPWINKTKAVAATNQQQYLARMFSLEPRLASYKPGLSACMRLLRLLFLFIYLFRFTAVWRFVFCAEFV